MTMKGLFAHLRRGLSVGLVLCMVIGLTLPALAEDEVCTHPNAHSEVTQEASCKAVGVMSYHCDECGAAWTADIPMAEHTWAVEPKYDNVVDADCATETDGSREAYIYCTECLAEKEDSRTHETIAWAHSWGEGVGIAATCTEAGELTYACTADGCTATKTEYPEALDHDFQLTTQGVSTCKDTAMSLYTCTRCPETDEREVPVNPEKHTGPVDEGTVTTKPTCTEDGVRTMVCDGCGESYTEVEPATGHAMTVVAGGTAATCTEAGVEKYACSVCGANELKPISALGHDLSSEVTTAATCTEQGERKFTCSRCTYVHTEPVAPLGHSYNKGEVTTDPTCADFGVKTYTCTREGCGQTKTEPVALLEHAWNDDAVTTDPTCTDFGVKTYTCTHTGCTATKTEPVAPLGHSFDETKVQIKAPTCTEFGVKTYTCTREGCTATKTESIAPTGNHTFGGTTVVVASTCVESGVGIRTCSVCGATKTETITKTTHNYGNAPTCKDAYCVVCGNKRAATTAHSWTSRTDGYTSGDNYWDDNYILWCELCQYEKHVTVHVDTTTNPPSWGEVTFSGNNYTICYNDTNTFKGTINNIPATSAPTGLVIHTIKTMQSSTCGKDGYITYSCNIGDNCPQKAKHTVVLSATGAHNMKQTGSTEATCNGTGSVTYTCTVCGATETKAIAALGHSFSADKVQTTDPTCTAEGAMTYTCTRAGCTATETKAIAALGHSYDAGTVTTAATCNTDGVRTYTCTRSDCGATKTQTISKTLQHTPGTVVYKVTKAATCTETGSQTATLSCEVCHNVINARTITLAATGHTAAAAKEENRVEAKCTVDGSYDSVIYCSVSGCGAEISRTTVKLVHPGHKPAAAVKENIVDPKCEEDGNYDSVVYCSVCSEELSRVNVIVDKTGHTPGAGVQENATNATCTAVGGYDTATYCSICNKELSREHTTLPATGHGTTELRNVTPATATSAGYTGDTVCSVCGEVLSTGTAIPALNAEEKIEVDPEIILNSLSEEIHLDASSMENLAVLAKEDGNNALELLSAVNETMDALAQELASGNMTMEQYEYAVTVANAATSAALQVGAKAGSAVEEAAEANENLPAEAGLDMGAIVGEFYQRQFDAILGKGDAAVKTTSAFGEMGNVKLTFVADASLTSTGLDLSIAPEVYENAMVFIDDSVAKMSDAAATLRTCSGQAMIASVKQYIEKVAVSTFRDFDKEAADEEFLQNAYEAILFNMQQQVSTSLTEAYDEAVKSGQYAGTARTELDTRYTEQMEAVADIETFEIMVLEVMRQKYISVLNVQLEAGTITREAYDAAWENAYDVEVFEPIYWAIFRAWALNEESEYPMTLQELTDATIADTTYATTHIELREGLSGKEAAFFTGAAVLALLLGAAYIVSDTMNRRKVVA